MTATKIHCSHDGIVNLKDLKPRPDNPNVHPQVQVDLLAKLQHGTGPMGLSIPGWVLCSCKRLDYSEHITVYRELEHARLDVMGSCDNYVYRAWLTKPSKNHPLGQVRSKVLPMVEGVRLEGNGKFMSVYLEGELIGNV